MAAIVNYNHQIPELSITLMMDFIFHDIQIKL
jgi:hypothetical protein